MRGSDLGVYGGMVLLYVGGWMVSGNAWWLVIGGSMMGIFGIIQRVNEGRERRGTGRWVSEWIETNAPGRPGR